MRKPIVTGNMKMLLGLIFTLIALVPAAGQSLDVAATFEKSKAKYTFEHFAEGEDASSGFDYLFYKSGDKIVKIRSIWSASHSREMRVEDFYFDGTNLLLFKKFTASDRLLSSLKKGRNGKLIPKEEFHFAAGKLSKWIVGGKAKTPGEADWDTTGQEVLDHAKSELENYGWLKEGK